MKTNRRNRCIGLIVGVAAVLAGVGTAWAGAETKPVDPFVKGSQPAAAHVKNETISLEQATEQKMKSIVIPEANLRNANIRDVISFLQSVSRENDDKSLPPEKRGVSFVLRSHPDVKDVPITFSAHSQTLWDLLKTVTDAADFKFRIRDNAVLIMPLNAIDENMETRFYVIMPNVVERASGMARDMIAVSVGSPDTGKPEPGQDLKKLFGDLGVAWPIGSSVTYLSVIGKLRVVNTPENLAVFEKLLEEMNVTPRQIEVEAQFVAFDTVSVEKLVAAGRLNMDALTNLWINGAGHLMASPRVVTKAGQEAVIKGVTEYIYPTTFSVAAGDGANTETVHDATNTNAAVKAAIPATSMHGRAVSLPVVEPGGFQTREAGTILQVVPEVSAGGGMINLQMSPQIVGKPDWRDYGTKYRDANGNDQQVSMEQPIFSVSSISTCVSVASGQRILMGGGTPSQDGKQMVYMFITARLVGISGEYLKSK